MSKELTFKELQSIASKWSRENFGEHFGTGYRNLLGLSEEVGELCHAQLKGEQGIRHTSEEILKLKKDAVGDIIIFLANYCDSQKIEMSECVEMALNEILKRDWSVSEDLKWDNLTYLEKEDLRLKRPELWRTLYREKFGQ
jgi:NTP pyrophosphatase (non-canonical NTP hydrolase)